MVERRHYITALILLLLPVVVIYALTSYGIEESTLNQDGKEVISKKTSYACQQKKIDKKASKTLRLDTAKEGI